MHTAAAGRWPERRTVDGDDPAKPGPLVVAEKNLLVMIELFVGKQRHQLREQGR